MQNAVKKALELGFTCAGILTVSTIQVLPEVRQMCASDKCHAYGKSWSCPPACGTLEECRRRLQAYQKGILVQTVGQLEDSFDFETMVETESDHKERFQTLCHELKKRWPELLAIGTGCCTLCRPCTYPHENCRFPDKMTSSMEAYGMLVSQVCRDNGLEYNHGNNTVTYTSCILLR